VRSTPEPFVLAARDAALSGDHLVNMRWLTAALAAAQSRLASLPAALTQMQAWLAYYWLAPERGMHANPRHDSREKVEAERAKRQAEIEARLSELTAAEQAFMETQLVRNDGENLSSLHQLAFELLAGTKLAGLNDAFVRWAFAKALNPSFYDPNREFAHLISLNSADWAETRQALLRSVAPFMKDGTSRTGRWALVTICARQEIQTTPRERRKSPKN
jgi:Skp family chaperone for outer membrane proteins